MNAGMKGFAASKAVTAAVTLWWAVCPLGLFQGQAQNDRTSIEFVSGQFNVSENTRTVTLPLRLVGTRFVLAPMVECATQDGTAVSGRDYVAQAGRAKVTYGWEQARGWGAPPYVTPHYWTAAEMLLLQLDMLAYLDESGSEPTLIIGAGIPKEWLDLTMSVKRLSTRLGTVDWEWRNGKMSVRVRGGHCAVRLGPAFPTDAKPKVKD